MNNRKIRLQVEEAQRAVDQLTEAGVEIRRIYLATDQERTVIVCVERRVADRGWQWCEDCRLVWLPGDVAHADGDITVEDQLPHAAMEARFGLPASPVSRPCRVCDSTELTACKNNDGTPCFWISPGLCSACAEAWGVDIEPHRSYGAEADIGHAIAGVARGELPR